MSTKCDEPQCLNKKNIDYQSDLKIKSSEDRFFGNKMYDKPNKENLIGNQKYSLNNQIHELKRNIKQAEIRLFSTAFELQQTIIKCVSQTQSRLTQIKSQLNQILLHQFSILNDIDYFENSKNNFFKLYKFQEELTSFAFSFYDSSNDFFNNYTFDSTTKQFGNLVVSPSQTLRKQTSSSKIMIKQANKDKRLLKSDIQRTESDGFNEIIEQNGTIYIGNRKDNMLFGKGIKFYANNTTFFKGDWVKNVKCGYGVYRWENGDIYEGFFVNDQRSGFGKFTENDGKVYVGNFVCGNKEGYGKEIEPNGKIYEGQWKAGKYNGKGTCTFPDKSTYEGDWEQGSRHGTGKETKGNGDFYDGQWENGKNMEKGSVKSTTNGLFEDYG